MHENVGIPCTHYFDDYTIIVPEVLGSTADELTGQFLKELGWEVKREKDKPTSDTFTALGVVFDLAAVVLSTDPSFEVRNKPTRIEEVCQSIDAHLARESMNQFGIKAKEPGPFLGINPDLREALKWWKIQIRTCKARVIRTGPQRPLV